MAKARKKKEPAQSNELLAALKFVSLAQHSEGETYKQHCRLSNNTASSFDGVLACGHPILDGLDAQPHTATIVKALAKCSASVSLTHVGDQILVASGAFKVRVPCEPAPLVPGKPDPATIGVGPTLAAALATLSNLPEDGHEMMSCRSVLIQAGSAVACHRGHIIIEAWHGIEALPFRLALPIRSIKAMLAAGKPFVAIGYSERSLTVHFEDGSWIKSQIEEGKWFDYASLLASQATYAPLPVSLLDGLAHIKDFTQDGRARFGDGILQTSDDSAAGASFECEGLRPGRTFKIEYLKNLIGVEEGGFDLYHDKGCMFYGLKSGVNVRGLIARMVQ